MTDSEFRKKRFENSVDNASAMLAQQRILAIHDDLKTLKRPILSIKDEYDKPEKFAELSKQLLNAIEQVGKVSDDGFAGELVTQLFRLKHNIDFRLQELSQEIKKTGRGK